MPDILFTNKFRYSKSLRLWFSDEQLGQSLEANQTHLIVASFKQSSSAKKWLDCCRAALECCRSNWAQLWATSFRESAGHLKDAQPSEKCPGTWDGLSCWPNSEAGQFARRYCPNYVYFLDFRPVCAGQVSKQCFANGSWFVKNSHEWSDYSLCPHLQVSLSRSVLLHRLP